jgi:tRNA1(Val) A37 N6-methylase TrmN6
LDGLGEIVEDRLLGGQVRLLQPKKGHRAGTDAVILAASLTGVAAARIADFGAGVGTVGLLAAARFPQARITLLERDPDLVALAHENITLNGWGNRVDAMEIDLLAPAQERRAAGLKAGMFDIVLTNPPWFRPGAVRVSPNIKRRRAHLFADGTLEGWMRAAADLLAPRGEIFVVHRADTIPDLLAALSGRFGGVTLRPVQPYADRPATRVLVRAIKGSRAPLGVEPALVLHQSGGHFAPEAEAMHRPDLSETDDQSL